jgi:hypothetical protein
VLAYERSPLTGFARRSRFRLHERKLVVPADMVFSLLKVTYPLVRVAYGEAGHQRERH